MKQINLNRTVSELSSIAEQIDNSNSAPLTLKQLIEKTKFFNVISPSAKEQEIIKLTKESYSRYVNVLHEDSFTDKSREKSFMLCELLLNIFRIAPCIASEEDINKISIAINTF